MDKKMRICFIGSGAISTAMGNVLAQKKNNEVFLLSVEQDVVDSISNDHINRKYFPNIDLEHSLKATFDKSILKESDIIFLGIPSSIIVSYIRENASFFGENAVIVNLAKGFGEGQKTIPQSLSKVIPNQIVSLKGPSFAREIINNMPTAFTLASKRDKYFKLFESVFANTSIYCDYTTDVMGVELASILKNIYAIIVGIVDAHFDSPNLRSLILTKAINEMRVIISKFGGEEYTMFNYCGFGDFTLTALNDLSRNRTLGLLIGKGFFTDYISEKVVLEGKVAVNIFVEEIAKKRGIKTKNLMLKELYKVFNEEDYDINNFVSNITTI